MVAVPAFTRYFTRGKTIDKCRESAAEAIKVHIAGLLADGELLRPRESPRPNC